jgi:hypothetical protein
MPKDFTVTNALRNNYANVLGVAPDGGTSNGILRIYDSDGSGGSTLIPATPEDAAVGTVLVDIPLADPSFGGAVNGQIAINAPPGPGTAVAAGIADYYRIYDSNDGVTPGNCHHQGTAGESADAPRDMILSNKNIAVNDEITVNTFTIDVARSVDTIP